MLMMGVWCWFELWFGCRLRDRCNQPCMDNYNIITRVETAQDWPEKSNKKYDFTKDFVMFLCGNFVIFFVTARVCLCSSNKTCAVFLSYFPTPLLELTGRNNHNFWLARCKTCLFVVHLNAKYTCFFRALESQRIARKMSDQITPLCVPRVCWCSIW